MPWGDPHPSTGKAIPICNGANEGKCTKAADVVKHRLRRPGKQPGPGDPDYVDDGPKEGEKKKAPVEPEIPSDLPKDPSKDPAAFL